MDIQPDGLNYTTFHDLSRPQLEHPRITISKFPLRIPIHFQPIKPTGDLQVIFEWTIHTKHDASADDVGGVHLADALGQIGGLHAVF